MRTCHLSTFEPVAREQLLADTQSLGLAAKQRQAKRVKAKRRPKKAGALPRLLSRSNYTGVPDKMLVVARADEDISYLSLYLPDIPHTIYQVG